MLLLLLDKTCPMQISARIRHQMTHILQHYKLPAGLTALLDRSVVAMTLADAQMPDFPLVGVNQKFCELTGYDGNAVLGRNCRFLQPQEGAGPVLKRIREFLADPPRTEERFAIPNERLDGSPFVNLVYIAKLRSDGKTRYLMGSQFNATFHKRDVERFYNAALSEDIARFNRIAAEAGWAMVGNFDALASSHVLIAQAKLDNSIT